MHIFNNAHISPSKLHSNLDMLYINNMKYLITIVCLLCSITAFSVLTKAQFLRKYTDAKIIEKNDKQVIIECNTIDHKISVKAIDNSSMSEDLKIYFGVDKKESINKNPMTDENLINYLGINEQRYKTSQRKKLQKNSKQIEYSTYGKLEPIAVQISKKIDAALFEGVNVIPTHIGQLMIVDDRSFSEIEKTKRQWLIVVVSAVGSVLNKNKQIKVNEVYMADSFYANELKKALMIKAVDCMKLQTMISDYKIDIDQFYSLILKSVKEVTF